MSVRSATEIITAITAPPDTQRARRFDGAVQHVMEWSCGCVAINGAGLCRLDGWDWSPCSVHAGRGTTVATVRAEIGVVSAQTATL